MKLLFLQSSKIINLVYGSSVYIYLQKIGYQYHISGIFIIINAIVLKYLCEKFSYKEGSRSYETY